MLDGSVAIVTGASRGIGRAITARLHQEGMDVAIVARSGEELRAVEHELGADGGTGRVLALPADVTDPSSATRVVASTEAAFGHVDLLVNNAGVTESDDHALWNADTDEWWRVVTTNVRAPMLFSKAVVPGMIERQNGRIININSLRAVHTLPTQTAYSVSKCALAKLTESLAASLEGTGVGVFDYSPGRVITNLTQSLDSLVSAPASSWTPIEMAVDGVITIAAGRLDNLTGRFLHAHDDLQELGDRADEIVRHEGRMVALSEAYAGDPLATRTVG